MTRLQVTADKHIKHDFVVTEIAELEKLIAAIEKLMNNFLDLHERALAELPPWPRTQFLQSRGISLTGRGKKSSA